MSTALDASRSDVARWIRAHGVDVGYGAGATQPGSVFALGSTNRR
jgi:hypothetical protein